MFANYRHVVYTGEQRRFAEPVVRQRPHARVDRPILQAVPTFRIKEPPQRQQPFGGASPTNEESNYEQW